MKEVARLCDPCEAENQRTCWFVREVDYVVSNVPPKKRQTQMLPDHEITNEAWKAQAEITRLREEVRDKRPTCPEINYDPNFPGRRTI